MLNNLSLWRGVALTGFLGMIATIVIWNGWIDSHQQAPRALEILILVSPLLFFVRGILAGRHSTHVKVTFVAILYFILGIWLAFTPNEEVYGFIVTLLSIFLYLGGFMTAKIIMKADIEREKTLG